MSDQCNDRILAHLGFTLDALELRLVEAARLLEQANGLMASARLLHDQACQRVVQAELFPD